MAKVTVIVEDTEHGGVSIKFASDPMVDPASNIEPTKAQQLGMLLIETVIEVTDAIPKIEAELSEDQRALVGSYHDGCNCDDLADLIGNEAELARLNEYRGTAWTQAELDTVLSVALAKRKAAGLA